MITPEQLAIALWVQQIWGGPIGRIMVSRGYISEPQLVSALSKQLDIPIVHLGGRVIPSTLAHIFPLGMCEQYLMVPFAREPESGVLQVAMADPMNSVAIEECKSHITGNVQVFLAGFIDITHSLWYNFKNSTRTGVFLLSEVQAQEKLYEEEGGTPFEITDDAILGEIPVGDMFENDEDEEISDLDGLVEEEYAIDDGYDTDLETKQVIRTGEVPVIPAGDSGAPRSDAEPSGTSIEELECDDFDELDVLEERPLDVHSGDGTKEIVGRDVSAETRRGEEGQASDDLSRTKTKHKK